MFNDAKRRQRQVNRGADAVDRISNLPKNVIDLILECLPLHDAARTTILSKTWMNIWETRPNLVFDDVFFSQLVSKKVGQAQQSQVSTTTISNILLLHTGPVLKFHLSIPQDLPLPYTDLWIKIISRSGTRIFQLCNKPWAAYKMPSYMFSCLELTHLRLTNCILNPPPRFGGFCNLIYVNLWKIIITADMSFGPKVEVLHLGLCTGIEHLGCQFKNSNNLVNLMIDDSEEIDWKWFECTKKVQFLSIMFMKELPNHRQKVIGLDILLGNMPTICCFSLDGFFLKFSEPVAAPLKNLVTVENLRALILTCVDSYDLIQMQCVLWLIRSLPNLQCMEISMKWNDAESLAATDGTKSLAVSRVERYLQLPNFAGMILNQLETVVVEGMVGLRSGFHFIKLLLASSPSLKWIKIPKGSIVDDPKEELKILEELAWFPRASTTAHIILT